MDEFRLRVFLAAARHLSFTRAARELFISQPAVTRHIRELENAYRTRLFERDGGRLALTGAGEILRTRAERIEEEFRMLAGEMNALNDRVEGRLRLGASTTVAQYVLPPVLSRFAARFPDVRLSMISGNSAAVEAALAEHRIDLGVVENASRRSDLHYEPFARDELVLVADPRRASGRLDEVTPEKLARLPLVLRETGSGTLQVVERALAAHGIRLGELNLSARLDSTEAIKSFLRHSDAAAIVSVAAVVPDLAAGRLKVIEIAGMPMERTFAFVRLRGAADELAERFMHMARSMRG